MQDKHELDNRLYALENRFAIVDRIRHNQLAPVWHKIVSHFNDKPTHLTPRQYKALEKKVAKAEKQMGEAMERIAKAATA
jgi:hypothetical protein